MTIHHSTKGSLRELTLMYPHVGTGWSDNFLGISISGFTWCRSGQILLSLKKGIWILKAEKSQ